MASSVCDGVGGEDKTTLLKDGKKAQAQDKKAGISEEVKKAASTSEPASKKMERTVSNESESTPEPNADDDVKRQTSEEAIERLVTEKGKVQREVREQRKRADAAEAKCEQLMACIHNLKSDLSAAASRECESQAYIKALEREKRSLSKVAAELEDLKASAWRDHELAAAVEATSRAEIENLCKQLKANNVEPKLLDDLQAEKQNALHQDKKKGKKAKSEKNEGAASPAVEVSGLIKTPVPVEAKPDAASAPAASSRVSSAKLAAQAAQIEEERKRALQRQKEEIKRREKERREQEEEDRQREQQRLEDEAREQAKAAKLAAEKESERKAAQEREARIREKKRQKQEEERRIAQEKETFSPEDFAALQALRGSVIEPEEEESPDELDEDTLLEKEIQRVKKEEEEKAKLASKATPLNWQQLMFSVESGIAPTPDAIETAKKNAQAKTRAELREKIKAKKDLEKMLGPRRTRC